MKLRKRARKAKARLLGHKRHSKLDTEATSCAGFKDKRSWVHCDGRWYCFGVDMSARRQQVWERDKGICQICFKLIGNPELWDLEHVKPRSQGRDDRMENLRVSHAMRDPLFDCHRKKHNREVCWTRKEKG